MKCSVCQAEIGGAYCQSCGAPGIGASCKGCDTALIPGARFCTGCGLALQEPKEQLPWFIAGAAVVALTVVLLLPAARGGQGGDPGFGMGGQGLPGELTGRAAPLTGTPREQADRLFNRVMQALSAGDAEQVSFFAPMGILAYQQASPLDNDGLYHLSLLEMVGGDPASGLATAQEILAGAPDHLLALAAAAQAADALGDRGSATRYYEHLLTVYEAERERPLPEYLEHAQILEPYREEAAEYLGR